MKTKNTRTTRKYHEWLIWLSVFRKHAPKLYRLRDFRERSRGCDVKKGKAAA